MTTVWKNNIIFGPEFYAPVPSESFGKQIYKSMINTSSNDIIFIDAVSGKHTTYREFLNLSCRLAQSLLNCGYKKDDVITVCSENNEFFFVPVVASLFLGIISAPINQTYKSTELLHLLNIVEPKIIFCSKKVLNSFTEIQHKLKYVEKIIILDSFVGEDGYETMFEFIEKHCEKRFDFTQFNPIDLNPIQDVAAILCSSGTTGMPKGVMVTHDNFSVRSSEIKDDPRMDGFDNQINCACLPFFHAFAFNMVITAIPTKAIFVVMQRFDEEVFLNAIQKYKINTLHIVPPIAHFLARSNLPLKYDLTSLQEVIIGAAPLSQEIEDQFNKRFPTIKHICQGYGCTEGTLALTLMYKGEKKIGSSGKVVPGHCAFVRDIETGEILGANKAGELCFRGRLVTKGYYRNPDATKSTYIDGWLHTGDIGYFDDEGYVFVVDRLKELIKYKGFQVPPAELEAILLSHPGVQDVGVVGKPDDVAGELPTAFVVRKTSSNVSESELIRYVAEKVSKPKQLHGGVYFLDVIPRTASGKIMRRILKQKLIEQKSKL